VFGKKLLSSLTLLVIQAVKLMLKVAVDSIHLILLF
jgi:hypothetical protein